MRCPQCGNVITHPGGCCPTCPPGTPAIDAGPLLARANLLRMRGQWEEAANHCIEVLRLEPGNPTAHSLLGDIYQDQGQPEEARHWYHLALELNPHSTADRAKLARSEEALEARTQKAEWEAIIEGRSEPIGTKLLVRESVQRIVAVAGTTVCSVILVAAILVSISERRVGPVDLGPVILTRKRQARAEVVVATPREHQLLKRLTEMPLATSAQVSSLSVDPRNQTAAVRLFMPARERDSRSIATFRDLVFREAYRVAHHLHLIDSSLTAIHVYVVGPTTFPGGEQATDALLVGTIASRNAVVSPDVVTPEELYQFFEDRLLGGDVAR